MRLLWIYLGAVLGVARSHSNEDTVHSQSHSTELSIQDSRDHNDTDHVHRSHLMNEDKLTKVREIWMWDIHCHLQPLGGTCAQKITRYYYDVQEEKCNPFVYSGCNGNLNNFEIANECERRCKGANFMGLNENSLPTVCHLQADPGMCLFFKTNVDLGKCMDFIYGGCGGNLNRFDSVEICEEFCRLEHPANKLSKHKNTTKSTTVKSLELT